MNALANGTSPVIPHTRWRIDPRRSTVEFRARSLGLQTVQGRSEPYDGTLDLSTQPSIELTIEADSPTTDNARRDEHLRSARVFDSANHPQVRFVCLSSPRWTPTACECGPAARRRQEHPARTRGGDST
jgi:polyisoprenoid-binding protein YceI